MRSTTLSLITLGCLGLLTGCAQMPTEPDPHQAAVVEEIRERLRSDPRARPPVPAPVVEPGAFVPPAPQPEQAAVEEVAAEPATEVAVEVADAEEVAAPAVGFRPGQPIAIRPAPAPQVREGTPAALLGLR